MGTASNSTPATKPDPDATDKCESAAPTEKPSLEKQTEDATADAPDAAAPDETVNHLKGTKLVLLIAALCLCIFLVALDQTIIAPALGAITAEYGSVKDIVRPPLFSPFSLSFPLFTAD